MITSYKHQGAKDIFNGNDTKYARKACPQNLWKIARRKLDQLDFAASLNDLRSPPRNRLEALKGDRKGQHSIRINDQYRVCFVWSNDAVKDVEIAVRPRVDVRRKGMLTKKSRLSLKKLWSIFLQIDHPLLQVRC